MQPINNIGDLAQFATGQVFHKTVTSGSYTPATDEQKTIVGIIPVGSCTITGIYTRSGTGFDTHLTTDGTSGGTAVTLTSPYFAEFSTVTVSAGTAILLVA